MRFGSNRQRDDTLGPVTREAIRRSWTPSRPRPACACSTLPVEPARSPPPRSGAAPRWSGWTSPRPWSPRRPGRHPGVEFRVADAEAIPLADASVDAVTCSFGLLHMERPERVLTEVTRVLRPGIGRFAMTAWVPEGDFFGVVGQAVQAHADMTVSLPPAPPIFRFADEGECRSALLAAGFAESGFRRLPLVWTGGTPESTLDLLHRGTVRAPMPIEAQAPEVRAAIEQAIRQGVERYSVDAERSCSAGPPCYDVRRA